MTCRLQPGSKFFSMAAVVGLAILICVMGASGQAKKDPIGTLDQFSNSVQALARQVSPSVVQILVTRYGARDETGRANVVMGWQQSIGSGVIIDPAGYIMTNAHVVNGAQQIGVRLAPAGDQTFANTVEHSYAAPKDAALIGVFKDGDLALLKIDAAGLPTLPFADYSKLRQGQVVFAFGSPQGLQNSMSMGVVSSTARQPDPDSPLLYIQTDAPINPGNSGGPLVNTAGEIVGLDTFIFTQSGGNEGIGFAIPSMLVHWVFEDLRKYGHVHRPVMGISLQTITPTLAAALKLPRSSGVLVSDVLPGSPAASAGLKINDVLLSLDGRPLESIPALMGFTFEHSTGTPVKVQVLRGTETLSFDVTPVEAQDDLDSLAQLANPSKSLIAPLGILGVTIDKRTMAMVGNLRYGSGVMVEARVRENAGLDTGLQAGDVIHDVNGNFVISVEALRAAVALLKPGDPTALLIERGGKLQYVSFEMK